MKILLLILSSCISFSVFSQYKDTIVLNQNTRIAVKAQYICVLGDVKRMELHPNGRIYQFKSGLSDGIYTAFIDDNYKDTAMVAVLEDGELNGLLIRWKDNQIAEECEYKNGLKDGWRKLYIYTDNYGRLINIEKCKEGACIEIYTEW